MSYVPIAVLAMCWTVGPRSKCPMSYYAWSTWRIEVSTRCVLVGLLTDVSPRRSVLDGTELPVLQVPGHGGDVWAPAPAAADAQALEGASSSSSSSPVPPLPWEAPPPAADPPPPVPDGLPLLEGDHALATTWRWGGRRRIKIGGGVGRSPSLFPHTWSLGRSPVVPVLHLEDDVVAPPAEVVAVVLHLHLSPAVSAVAAGLLPPPAASPAAGHPLHDVRAQHGAGEGGDGHHGHHHHQRLPVHGGDGGRRHGWKLSVASFFNANLFICSCRQGCHVNKTKKL